jgi:hypothetical protein
MVRATEELKELNIPPDIDRYGDCAMRHGDKTILEFFLNLVANGESPRMAEALAMQQSPGVGVTDTVYIQDQNRHGRNILERMGGDQRAVDDLRKSLARNGYKLRSDDHYIPTAARFRGDPQAIVNGTQTFGDLQKRLVNRGTATFGAVDTKHDAERARTKQHSRLSPSIVKRIDKRNLEADPDLARVSVRDRHADIVEKHGAKKKEN